MSAAGKTETIPEEGSGFAPGIEVAIGSIDRELGRLWEESGDTKTRASLINFAIYSELPDALERNTALLARIAGRHAFRGIVVAANPAAPGPAARAWISAHCQTAGKGGRQICSEQISFQFDGPMQEAARNIVFSHLDSDLPLCLWWQAEFQEPFDVKFWICVDRLLFDSREWAEPGPQLAAVRKISSLPGVRAVLCDLNWSRILSCRTALAHAFDHPTALGKIREIRSVRIVHGGGSRPTALLLLGWLISRFRWRLDPVLGAFSLSDAAGRAVAFDVVESAGAPCIASVEIDAGGVSVAVSREAGSEFFHAAVGESRQMLPAGRDRIDDILLGELGRGGKHPLYPDALDAVAPLLA